MTYPGEIEPIPAAKTFYSLPRWAITIGIFVTAGILFVSTLTWKASRRTSFCTYGYELADLGEHGFQCMQQSFPYIDGTNKLKAKDSYADGGIFITVQQAESLNGYGDAGFYTIPPILYAPGGIHSPTIDAIEHRLRKLEGKKELVHGQ